MFGKTSGFSNAKEAASDFWTPRTPLPNGDMEKDLPNRL